MSTKPTKTPNPTIPSLITRRQMLSITGIAGLTALVWNPANAFPRAQQKRPRIAALVSYWGENRVHADWVVNKLIDGYWWDGAHMASRVDVVAIYIHQLDTSLLGQKVAKAKGIPIFKTVGEAVTLGGTELAVDGVVIVAEQGNYPKDIQGNWLLPRWLIYQQVIQVFEKSKRSVPVFNDKHLSYNWHEAKWMFDKSRELNFPLTGGSSIPTYFRKPEIELDLDTPLTNSIVLAAAGDEGAIFHAIDVLQCFMERRKGGETGVKSVQSFRGPEASKWVESNSWVGKLVDSVETQMEYKKGYFKERGITNICVVEYNDGITGAVVGVRDPSWTFAGGIAGKSEPTVISMIGWPGNYDQYLASNSQPHWLIEMMLTRKEPFNAERLLLSTGILNVYQDSNWENGKYSPLGRRLETPFLNIKYRPTHGPQFSKGQRPPAKAFIRGFDK